MFTPAPGGVEVGMRLRLPPAVRATVAVVVGAAVIGTVFLPAVFGVANDEGEDPTDGLIGATLLLAPYLVFALTGRHAPLGAWIALLLVLLAGTSLGLVAAGSSSTGGLIFLWLLPLQLVVASCAVFLGARTVRGDRGRS